MIRFRYRAAIFGAIVALLIAGRYYPELAAWPTAASPFLGVAALIGTGTLIVPALVLAAVCLFRRRILCHSVCPLGFCFDVLGKARKKITGSNRLPKIFHDFPRLGIFLAVFTWLGCGLGVVGFLWLDPLVLFGSLFLYDDRFPAGGFSRNIIFLVLLLGATWLLPTFWCRCFCPLGGTQDLLHSPKSLVDKTRTKTRGGEKRPDTRHRRRLLVYGTIFLLLGFLFRDYRRKTVACTYLYPRRRPPGALEEPYLFALCTRCGSCVQACPTKYLEMGIGQLDIDEACPVVSRSSKTYCRHDCNACSQVCPTGAIRKFTIEEKKGIKLALAVLSDFEKCRLYEDVECSICRRDCPYDAVSYEWSDEEYRRIPVIDPETCTGCGRCVVSCPGLGKNEPKPLKITNPFVQ